MPSNDPARDNLVAAVDQARREWQEAWNMFDEAPPAAAEPAIHLLNAAEARYIHLLRLAKKEGAVAWTTPLANLIQQAAESSD